MINDSYITIQTEKGSINISEDVISAVVSAALKEVDGAAGLAHAYGAELAEMLGRKSLSKGVKVQFVDNSVIVDIVILVRFGCNIASVAQKVQEVASSSLEAMTGQSSVINVHVAGVSMEK